MLNEITDKEREVQYALGLVSWYYIETKAYSHTWNSRGNFKAVSEEDALQQFVDHLFAPDYMKEAILRDIDEGRYMIKILPWERCYK